MGGAFGGSLSATDDTTMCRLFVLAACHRCQRGKSGRAPLELWQTDNGSSRNTQEGGGGGGFFLMYNNSSDNKNMCKLSCSCRSGRSKIFYCLYRVPLFSRTFRVGQHPSHRDARVSSSHVNRLLISLFPSFLPFYCFHSLQTPQEC